MLLNTDAEVERSRALISGYKNGTNSMTSELWHAKKVLDSTLHPDTGTPVFLPLRMSSYVLSNLVVTLGMLTPNLGTAGTLFWQIANQSLNVAVNTANANKSTPLTTQQLITNYTLAVSASCSVALGLNALVPRLKSITPSTRVILGRLVPFAAVVSAGVVNVGLMRSEEIKRGISVFDAETGEELGTSKSAAKYAVGETALSRVFNATPIMAVPPLILVKLQQMNFLKNKGNFRLSMVNLGLITFTSFIALPFALAAFPQRRTIEVTKLEESFLGLKNKAGHEVSKVEFNRGM
ncbi:tricarboxylate carrier [Nadsonia fulvescens var. elongata DSM 6958]|uniref:Tricarboxylate carrier n=1 Tax=Nadsonia fulvescens var. elongata DSM 6958 TaxID=857566 RepID=A0A1E3PP25_9ASCO|nr:tricarboxylate carrier [Nadsonia fulvescens var. elongata DSM 6958]